MSKGKGSLRDIIAVVEGLEAVADCPISAVRMEFEQLRFQATKRVLTWREIGC